jgi:hypothetical protein
MSHDERKSSIGFWDTVKRVLAAFFGVQSEANRTRDFKQGNPLHFILIALGATVIFVLVVWAIVSFVLSAAQVG